MSSRCWPIKPLVAKLRFKKGDVLVIKSATPVDVALLGRLREQLAQHAGFPVPVFTIGPTDSLSVLTLEQIKEARGCTTETPT